MSEVNDSDETGIVTELRVRARALAGAARGRFDRSPAQAFVRQLGALDFVNTSIIFGAALLTSVLPFIILLSALANHRIDSDLSRHIGLNRQGALVVSQLTGRISCQSRAWSNSPWRGGLRAWSAGSGF
jgi:hypothetical protein